MIYLIAGLLITFACYVLFLVSDKQRPETPKSHVGLSVQNIIKSADIWLLANLTATLILLINVKAAVWVVSVYFVFATPILFLDTAFSIK